ncbi:unnamed protein product [Phytophthora fragariaefolia]|uniref:Unnamed protein product n=1 Tax=Phytophthora fragariaefolia TaxID=1490495 RepID=A0A9W6U080_9STRA|nr:unnamed protein product [Phytophthora fragariaefolia]
MEDSGSRLPIRQDFPHPSDTHWATLEKMVSLLGEAALVGFPNLPAEQQRARVECFDKYKSLLIAHVSATAQEAARGAMRAEAQSAVQASATNTASFAARPTTTKSVKMSVPTFDGKDSDSLVFWVREIEIALSAGQIYDARAQVALARPILEGAHAHGPWPVKRQLRGTSPRGSLWNRSFAPPSFLPMWRIVTGLIACDASKASGHFKTTSWSSITSKPP